MMLVQASITGKIACGSIHIQNVGGTQEMGLYAVTCFRPDGSIEWTASVQHDRREPWYVLVNKATCEAALKSVVEGS